MVMISKSTIFIKKWKSPNNGQKNGEKQVALLAKESVLRMFWAFDAYLIYVFFYTPLMFIFFVIRIFYFEGFRV
jgi:hypothetical protein